MTTWLERFQHALGAMCGSLPPMEICQEWFDHIEVDGQYRLQNWIFSKGNKTPKWAQAIVTIEAAEIWANEPEEGAGHAPRPKGNADMEDVNQGVKTPDKMSAKKHQGKPVPMSYFVEDCFNQITQFDEGDDAGLLAFIKQQTKPNRPIRVYFQPSTKRRTVANEER